MAQAPSVAPTPETVITDPHVHEGRRLSRVMVGILIAYVAFILVLMVVRGAYMSPDLFVVLALVIVGRQQDRPVRADGLEA